MKKILLSFSIITFAIQLNGQSLILTQSGYEPAIGDVNNYYNLDTTAFTSGMPTTITGTNVTWDFSALAVNPPLVTTNYVDPTTLTVTVPSGATVAEEQAPGSYNFFKSVTSPTTQTELLAVKMGTMGLNFTNTAIVARYPVSYGYSLNDPIAGTVDFSVTANFSGNIVTNADGEGTLLMPQGNTFNNVLRVKSVQNITVTVFIVPIAEVKQISYRYFHASSKFPILTVNQTITTFSSQTTNVSSATGNADFLTIGLKEYHLDNLNFVAYPNPAKDVINIQLPKGETVEAVSLKNMLGQTIMESNTSSSINVSSLPAGSYMLEVKSKNAIGHKTIMLGQ